MEKINVLITSAGRRVSLVKNFQLHSNVFTCDANPELSAACQFSGKFFKVPKVNDKTYLDELFNICKKNNIKIVIPTIDPELLILSKAKRRFKDEDIMVAVSDYKICKTFSLKTNTFEFFTNRHFLTPKIITDLETAQYPLFAKLNNSSLSKGATKVENMEEALILKKKNKNYVFQEYIEAPEFTVDVFVHKNGKVVCVVPRKRLEIRAGEVSKGQTVKDKTIIKNIKQLCEMFKGAYGVLTVQVFKKGDDIYFIEINPRFGGGYPLSWLAGADFAKFIIDDYENKTLNYTEDWKDNLIMLRYDAEVLIDGCGI
ncbi:ATP-grasp domain-containing protein [Nautilia sp.]